MDILKRLRRGSAKRDTRALSEATERGETGWREGAHINDVVDCSTSPAARTLSEVLPNNVQHIQDGAHKTGGGRRMAGLFTSIGNRFSVSVDKFDDYVFRRGAATQFPSVAGQNMALDEDHSDNKDSEFTHPPASSTGFPDFPEQRGTVIREFGVQDERPKRPQRKREDMGTFSFTENDSTSFVDVATGDYDQSQANTDDNLSIYELGDTSRQASLFSMHSSGPGLPLLVQKLAQIPDDPDDDGGIESALLKLEGKFDQKRSNIPEKGRARDNPTQSNNFGVASRLPGRGGKNSPPLEENQISFGEGGLGHGCLEYLETVRSVDVISKQSPVALYDYFEEEREEIEEVLRPHASSGGSYHVRSNVPENNVAQEREKIIDVEHEASPEHDSSTLAELALDPSTFDQEIDSFFDNLQRLDEVKYDFSNFPPDGSEFGAGRDQVPSMVMGTTPTFGQQPSPAIISGQEESVIDTFRIGHTLGSRQRTREDDELSHNSNMSVASSLASVVDSIFTIASGSSMSSLPGPQGAGERLVSLFLDDTVIKRICSYAVLLIEKERFERNLRRLIKDFAAELQKEAGTVEQRHVVNFVRFRARNSAHMMCNLLVEKNSPRVEKRIPNAADEEEVDSEDDDSAPSDDELDNLKQLEKFINESRAFEIFRTKLKAFVYPPEKGVDHARVDPEEMSEEGNNSVADEKMTSTQRSSSGLDMIATAFRMTRQPIPRGKTRIEWKCKCGHTIYDDFIELVPGATNRFKHTLTNSDNSSTSTENSRVSNSASSFTTCLRSFSSFFTISGRSTKNSLPLHERHMPLNALPHGNPQPPDPATHLLEPQFLPICYSEGRYATGLLQPELVSLQNLSWIKFVHFELYCSALVDVRKVDDIPSPEDVEYRYAPVPPDVIPPVGDNHLMHLFQNPTCASTSPVLMQRFPKKLLRPLTCPSVNPLTPGWGIQFLEAWDLKKIWLIAFLLFGLGSALIGILWCVFKHNVQDAFAIAAYVIAFGAVSVGSVQALVVM